MSPDLTPRRISMPSHPIREGGRLEPPICHTKARPRLSFFLSEVAFVCGSEELLVSCLSVWCCVCGVGSGSVGWVLSCGVS